MRISEIFYSVQGEGILAGVPSVFIRSSGCNLRCSWCDTPYTSWKPEGEEMTIDAILESVASFSAARHAVITGGEPMIANGVVELSEKLRARGMHITVETAGTVFTPVACDLMSISPKLANSTPEGVFHDRHEQLRLQPDVLRRLTQDYDYQLKFVVASESDLAELQQIAALVNAPPDKIILMPEGTHADVLSQRGLWIAELCKQHGYRFGPRLHVYLWGTKRGV
ncbi:MAG TPA: 7-carboxy-7-deazaguanine synthase QueE [Bryobacteraceae bacterium]|nr:7-carboxy-7-deazaguanine synthase QueE [Bryobacteraceae bacterium]